MVLSRHRTAKTPRELRGESPFWIEIGDFREVAGRVGKKRFGPRWRGSLRSTMRTSSPTEEVGEGERVLRAFRVETQRPANARPLVERDLPLPEPGRGDVRLRVLACGVCRTDVHVAEGDLPLRGGPVVPGHQIVGDVEAVGAGVEWPKVGERVGVTWLASTCGRCNACRAGRENLCPNATFTGWDRDGGFAERTVARADFCVALPKTLAAIDAAPLLCAGIIGFRALNLAGAAPGARVGLVGFGASAHLALQAARARGCEVVVFTRGEGHQREARTLGAAWAGPLVDGPGAPAECDAIISFAPSGDVVPAALWRLRPGGTLAINAVHATDIPSFAYERIFGERVLRSVSNLTRDDARAFLRLALDTPLRTHPVPYPFERANDALADVAASKLEGQAVLEVAS